MECDDLLLAISKEFDPFMQFSTFFFLVLKEFFFVNGMV